ncbi:MAG: hypothetical protein OHK0017_06590 [Patescibacteria group bacterium]
MSQKTKTKKHSKLIEKQDVKSVETQAQIRANWFMVITVLVVALISVISFTLSQYGDVFKTATNNQKDQPSKTATKPAESSPAKAQQQTPAQETSKDDTSAGTNVTLTIKDNPDLKQPAK